MYDDLIKTLRNVDEYDSGYAKLMYDAADAIEAQDRHILTLQREMMAEAESHTALVERLNKQIERLQADVRPVVHGRWESAAGKRARFCSRCYHDEPYKFADEDADVYNFCPNCGADMRPKPPKEESNGV